MNEFAVHVVTAIRSMTRGLAQRIYQVIRNFNVRSIVVSNDACAYACHGMMQCARQQVLLPADAPTGTPIVITGQRASIGSRSVFFGRLPIGVTINPL